MVKVLVEKSGEFETLELSAEAAALSEALTAHLRDAPGSEEPIPILGIGAETARKIIEFLELAKDAAKTAELNIIRPLRGDGTLSVENGVPASAKAFADSVGDMASFELLKGADSGVFGVESLKKLMAAKIAARYRSWDKAKRAAVFRDCGAEYAGGGTADFTPEEEAAAEVEYEWMKHEQDIEPEIVALEAKLEAEKAAAAGGAGGAAAGGAGAE